MHRGSDLSDLFLVAAYLKGDKAMVKRIVTGRIILAVILVVILLPIIITALSIGKSPSLPPLKYPYSDQWRSTYTADFQDESFSYWNVTPSQFLSDINEALGDEELQLSFLPFDDERYSKDDFPSPYSDMIYVYLCDSNGASRFQIAVKAKRPAREWTSSGEWLEGNIHWISFYLLQNAAHSQENNQRYLRCLAEFFNPGSGDFVIENLDLSADGEQNSRVQVYTTFYNHNSGYPTFGVYPEPIPR